MGTKRVGLARTQALIQNLKRELQMNGSRLIDVKGTEMCVYSGEISGDGSGGFGATTGITVPANSVITGLGVVVTTAFVCSSATLGVNFGTAADGHDAPRTWYRYAAVGHACSRTPPFRVSNFHTSPLPTPTLQQAVWAPAGPEGPA